MRIPPLLLLPVILLLFLPLHWLTGYQQFSLETVTRLVDGTLPESTAYILMEIRLPRTLIAPLVGAALAVSGLMLQAQSRNPLAAPEMMGMNAAAGLAVVIAISFFDPSLYQLSLFALIASVGAAAVGFVITHVAGGSRSILTLPLVGATLTLFFGTFTQALLAINENTLDEALFWLSGSIADRSFAHLGMGAPLLLIGAALSLYLIRDMSLSALDEQLAKGLGQSWVKVQIMSVLCAACLAAGSVIIAGPVVFVGLVAPHAARMLVGHQFGPLLAATALVGALLVSLSDWAARFLLYPDEAPLSVLTALIGVPCVIYWMKNDSRMRALP